MQLGMWNVKGDTIAEMRNGIWKQKYIMKCEKENMYEDGKCSE